MRPKQRQSYSYGYGNSNITGQTLQSKAPGKVAMSMLNKRTVTPPSSHPHTQTKPKKKNRKKKRKMLPTTAATRRRRRRRHWARPPPSSSWGQFSPIACLLTGFLMSCVCPFMQDIISHGWPLSGCRSDQTTPEHSRDQRPEQTVACPRRSLCLRLPPETYL